MEIRPGIHRIPGLKCSNAFLLVEDSGLTLIDGGLPGDGSKVLNYISRLGHAPPRPAAHHPHPQPSRPFRTNERAIPVKWSLHNHPLERHPVPGENRRTVATLPRPTTRLRLEPPFFRRIPVHETIEDGEVLPVMGGLQVLHTPGHTPGSVCLHLPEHGVLFTGDMLLANGRRFRRPVYFPGTDLEDYRALMDRLAGLTFDTACVGHGDALLEDGSVRLQEMLANYQWISPRWTEFKRWTRLLFPH